MKLDARTVDSSGPWNFDVCIVGAGAVGITLAYELAAGSTSVALIESGGLVPDVQTQALYRGSAEGTVLDARPGYLSDSRLRYFGGSTNHWSGWCHPLDRLDFERRDWVPHSGWPIGHETLTPYSARAAAILGVEPFEEDEEGVREGALLFEDDAFLTKWYHLSPPIRFGSAYRDELVSSPNVSVFLHANALGLTANEAASRISRVEIATLGGRRFSVGARLFVLAAGGIENARLLLLSGPGEGGLGNEHGLVGRYFMDHPRINGAAAVVLTAPSRSYELYRARGARTRNPPEVGQLVPSEATQRANRLLNVALPLTHHRIAASVPPLANLAEALYELDRLGDPSRSLLPRPLLARVDVRCEPSPDPESRVRLGTERDALGQRRVRLAWRVGDAELRTVRRVLDLAARALGRSSQGRIGLRIDEEAPWEEASVGSHHMGTTRMADDPRRGVVDSDGRVHGVANLFVGGSSVFPTAGVANPTFTIVALALRLAEHLRSELRRG